MKNCNCNHMDTSVVGQDVFSNRSIVSNSDIIPSFKPVSRPVSSKVKPVSSKVKGLAPETLTPTQNNPLIPIGVPLSGGTILTPPTVPNETPTTVENKNPVSTGIPIKRPGQPTTENKKDTVTPPVVTTSDNTMKAGFDMSMIVKIVVGMIVVGILVYMFKNAK